MFGGGLVQAQKTERPMASVIPKGVTWIQRAVSSVDPHSRSLALDDDSEVHYSWLVVAAGIQLDWKKIDGLTETLGKKWRVKQLLARDC